AAVPGSVRLSDPFYQRKDDEHNHRADRGIHDGPDRARCELDMQLRQNPARHERSDDADDDVADQPKSRPVDNLAGKPAGDRANDERCENSHRKRPQKKVTSPAILEQKPSRSRAPPSLAPLDAGHPTGNLSLMFLQFFTSLRDAQVPVTLREYLTLMEALDADLADYTVENFYYLSRTSLVKDERNLDKFDRVFGTVFKGLESLLDAMEKAEIPEEW